MPMPRWTCGDCGGHERVHRVTDGIRRRVCPCSARPAAQGRRSDLVSAHAAEFGHDRLLANRVTVWRALGRDW